MIITKISNEKLLKMCKVWGKTALGARNKFIGLLPEVNRRKLYEKKFVSIFHFAAVMAGVSREQVSRVLSLSDKFENMPNLLDLLVSGAVSVNKLARVASVATMKNEKKLSDLVLKLSKTALETFVRDTLIAKAQKNESQTIETEIEDGLFETKNADTFVPGHKQQLPLRRHVDSKARRRVSERTKSQVDFTTQNQRVIVQPFEYVSNPPLNNNIKKKLNELAQKGIDINGLIEQALAQREAELIEEKQRTAVKAKEKLIEQIVEGKTITRVAPVATKRLLKKEHGTKCSHPFCNKPSQEIHHSDRFALSQIHDPHFMAPLCRAHHQIAHAIDTKSIEMRHRHH